MAQKNAWIARTQFSYEDTDTYADSGDDVEALRLEGQGLVETAPTLDNHIVRLSDLNDAVSSSSSEKRLYHIFIPDTAAITVTGDDKIIRPEGGAGNTLTVSAIQASAHACNGASGSTTWRLCTTAKGGSTTNSIALVMSYDTLYARATGSFTITVGDLIYLYCEGATALHQDVSFNIQIEGN